MKLGETFGSGDHRKNALFEERANIPVTPPKKDRH
jgi:hypothetical protein